MQFNHRTVKGQPGVNPRKPCFVLLNQNLEPGLFPGAAQHPKGGWEEGKRGRQRKENEQARLALGWCHYAPKRPCLTRPSDSVTYTGESRRKGREIEEPPTAKEW